MGTCAHLVGARGRAPAHQRRRQQLRTGERGSKPLRNKKALSEDVRADSSRLMCRGSVARETLKDAVFWRWQRPARTRAPYERPRSLATRRARVPFLRKRVRRSTGLSRLAHPRRYGRASRESRVDGTESARAV